MRRTKIVCTLGPATNTPETIRALIDAGMNCARLNFSHGDHEGHRVTAERVRAAAADARKPLAILADLQGPKMRIGRFEDGSISLEAGEVFTLTTAPCEGTQKRVSVTYDRLAQDVRTGDQVVLDDGLIHLEVTGIDGHEVQTKVVVGGTLSNNKGLNLPGVKVSAPALTLKDQRDLEFAISVLKVDYVALSFVRSPQDIAEVKALAPDIPVIAKIERPEAVEVLEDIVDAADGIMVARGDLGVELGAEKVPLIQKRIIRETNAHGKIVITATQMLDSMMRNPRPTRAEAADVANAVMDGTDAVMLSGETAAGRYPIESLVMMDKIIREVESEYVEAITESSSRAGINEQEWRFPNGAARAAAMLSVHLPLRAVVVFTTDGRSASLLAEHRPRAPIVAITSNITVAQRISLNWGVLARLEVPPESLDETLRIATSVLVRERLCDKGEPFAMVVGWPTSGRTNTVKLHRL